ncbi:APSES transcription factor Xbp1 [Sarocladium implicatum]|nr:APSES transcription factor Xbp1 [Sarocladium implicatum]
MSLVTLLNPNDVDPGGSSSVRSTPDPTTPVSVTSLPEPWVPATHLSSLHRRNDSYESTSTSSSQHSEGMDQIRYPPFNNLDANAHRLAMRFNVEPLGAIVPSPRPVSYNSDKRELKAKTGLNKFHVFQYSFQLEGEDKKWVVMWDFRLGLVRFTPFFKCLKYSKTAPARMVNVNPGLDEIKYNITGGSTHAQGYWVPYHCARELATKFCYHIAGALIPIFGPNFPDDCLHPNSPSFEDMVISQETIRNAAMDVFRTRHRQQRARMANKSPAITSHPQTPDETVASFIGKARSRIENRWSEPPSRRFEMPLATHHSPCTSRPGTQDGSSHPLYMATPQATPTLSYSPCASPPGESLAPFGSDLSLPPLRSYLQQMASEVLSIRSGTGASRHGEDVVMSNVDPRLRNVDDEQALFLLCDGTSEPPQGWIWDMKCGSEFGESSAVLHAAHVLLRMRYQ